MWLRPPGPAAVYADACKAACGNAAVRTCAPLVHAVGHAHIFPFLFFPRLPLMQTLVSFVEAEKEKKKTFRREKKEPHKSS